MSGHYLIAFERDSIYGIRKELIINCKDLKTISRIWLYVLMRLYDNIHKGIAYEMRMTDVDTQNGIRLEGEILTEQISSLHYLMRCRNETKLPVLSWYIHLYEPHLMLNHFPAEYIPVEGNVAFYQYYNITPDPQIDKAIGTYERYFGKIVIPSTPLTDFISMESFGHFYSFSMKSPDKIGTDYTKVIKNTPNHERLRSIYNRDILTKRRLF